MQFIILADIFEVIGSLVGLLVLVLWVVRKIFEANNQAAPKPARPAEAGGQPPAARQGPVRAGGQQADPLRNQVEEFLRRAGRAPQAEEGRAGQPRPKQPAATPEVELLVEEQVAQRRGPLVEQRQVADARVPETPQAVTPLQPAAEAVRKRGLRSSLAMPREETLVERADDRAEARARKLTARSSRLGKRIIDEDEQFDVQLKERFGHVIGTLGGTPEPLDQAATGSESPASQIAAMLASPEGMRQAIVLNEILRRPDERW